MFIKKLILFLLFVIQVFLLKSQSPYLKNRSIKDGLPTCETYHIFQDSKAYIWIATDFGVSRYDGYIFQGFDCSHGLPDNTVLEIYEDYKGKIWFIPFSSQLSYFYNDSIYIFKHNSKLREQIKYIYKPPPKQSFFIDSLDNIYYSQNFYEAFKIAADGKIEKFNCDTSDETELIYVKKGCGAFGLCSESSESNRTKIIYDDTSVIIENHNCPTDLIRSVIIDNKGDIIFYRRSNIIYKVSGNKIIKKHQLKYTPAWISVDSENNLWIGTVKNGVFCYKNANPDTKPVYHLLDNSSVTSVLEDREGGYWFSTTDNGIYHMPAADIKILRKGKQLKSSDIQCISGKKNQLFVGTVISQFNYLYNKLLFKDAGIVEFPVGVSRALLYYEKKDALYFCYHIGKQGVICKLDKNGLHKLPVIVDGKINCNIKLRALCMNPGKDGIIWVGDHKGIYKIKNDTVIVDNKSFKLNLRVNALLQNNSNNLYIAAKTGLYKYRLNNYEYDSLIYLGDGNKLFQRRVDDLLWIAKDSSLWTATRGAGIIISKNDKVVQVIDKYKGLTSNFITALYLENENTVWAGTNYGLNRIEIIGNFEKQFKIQTYTIGLASYKINDIYVYCNNVYLATNSGLTVFNNKEILPNTVEPPTYITNVSIAGKDTLVKEHYDLPYNLNSLNISFVGLSFKKSGKLTYKYKLVKNGRPVKWMTTTNTNVSYPFLPHGNYEFSVYTLNEDNYRSRETAKVSFTIKPPFRQTLWFVLIIILFIALLVFTILFIIYRIKLKEMKKRVKLEKRMNDYLSQALQKQMNPHFIFNSLNSIQSFIIKNDKVNSSLYLSKFSGLMRLVLENSRRHLVTLESEIESLRLYIDLEMLRFEKSLRCEFIIDENLQTSKCLVPPMIIQPFVENAILHGLTPKDENGVLLINFGFTEEGIICFIEDNGIGRQKAKEIKASRISKTKSLGSKLTFLRINLINSLNTWKLQAEYEDIYNDEGLPEGTRVKIKFPEIRQF
ncbi:MAG: histidine kinase [Bacteroidales bacterium]|nr:histidine kinase [Bacteroidales bacterium]